MSIPSKTGERNSSLTISLNLSLDDIAERIVEAHDSTLSALRTSVQRAIDVGQLLALAKQKLGHGKLLPWLASNCGFSGATARRYMRLAKRLPDLKLLNVSNLGLSDAYRLIEGPPAKEPPAALLRGMAARVDCEWRGGSRQGERA